MSAIVAGTRSSHNKYSNNLNNNNNEDDDEKWGHKYTTTRIKT